MAALSRGSPRPEERRMRCQKRLVLGAVLLGALTAAAAPPQADPAAERARVEAWRAARAQGLTSDDGWLTLAGLFWLKEGENSFGRAAGNTLVLEHAALAARAGTFLLTGT